MNDFVSNLLTMIFIVGAFIAIRRVLYGPSLRPDPKLAYEDQWESSAQCTSCKETLTRKEEYNSRGVCPHCGAFASGRTIVKTSRVVFRWRRDKDGGEEYREFKGEHPS